jgi:hypothetical protein
MVISQFIIDLFLEFVGELVGHFIPDWSPESKFEKHIKRLKDEAWFSSLLEDYRYEYIIFQNSRVKRFLCNERNIKMITSMDEEREKFIRLVKEEHVKFTKLR